MRLFFHSNYHHQWKMYHYQNYFRQNFKNWKTCVGLRVRRKEGRISDAGVGGRWLTVRRKIGKTENVRRKRKTFIKIILLKIFKTKKLTFRFCRTEGQTSDADTVLETTFFGRIGRTHHPLNLRSKTRISGGLALSDFNFWWIISLLGFFVWTTDMFFRSWRLDFCTHLAHLSLSFRQWNKL